MVNNMNKKVKIRYDRIIICIIVVSLILFVFVKGISLIVNMINPKMETMYLAGETNKIVLYDDEYVKQNEENRGKSILVYSETLDDEYVKIKIDNKNYYVTKASLVKSKNDVVTKENLFVRTQTTMYDDNINISTILKKGTKVNIIGFDEIDESGNVVNYKVKYNSNEGYINNKYLVDTKELSLENYDASGSYLVHSKRTSTYGGNAGELDFYPREKPKFKDNVMPEKVSALYLNGSAASNVDAYITLAKNSKVNSFVVDIKDSVLSYQSEIARELSPKSYKYAISSVDKYKKNIDKLKENGYYVIGRISVFKDSLYAADNIADAITDKNGDLYKHNGAYWPSAYSLNVWEYNIKLALEAIELFGFNEIQFDYVRFPDGTSSLEKDGVINMKNTYQISKIQAIQTFLMYATDVIHQENVYVSADVFGESAHEYVNSYGQYWGAISNVVDVISAMPYPDHFNIHQYGIAEAVWTNPYKLLYTWSKSFAMKRQAEVPTPAIVRTWIQAYNTTKTPATIYDSTKIADQIRALNESGATGGYMTWNSASSLTKYESIIDAL